VAGAAARLVACGAFDASVMVGELLAALAAAAAEYQQQQQQAAAGAELGGLMGGLGGLGGGGSDNDATRGGQSVAVAGALIRGIAGVVAGSMGSGDGGGGSGGWSGGGSGSGSRSGSGTATSMGVHTAAGMKTTATTTTTTAGGGGGGGAVVDWAGPAHPLARALRAFPSAAPPAVLAAVTTLLGGAVPVEIC
jgi:hypothetical protein